MFAKIDKDAKNTVVCKDSPQAELKFIRHDEGFWQTRAFQLFLTILEHSHATKRTTARSLQGGCMSADP